MTWPVMLQLSTAAYPLGVVQRTVYSLADRLAIQVNIETDHLGLIIFPTQTNLQLEEHARALVLQRLNDFALRDQINRETAGLREALIHAALSGCETRQ